MSQVIPNGKTLLFISTGIVALMLGVTVWLSQTPSPRISDLPATKTQKATVLPELKALPPFSLSDQTGRRFNNQSLLGQWTFISFGYTYCPDICPTTLAMLTQLDQQLAAQVISAPYQVAFVSIDPERDTPQRLAEYMDYFNPAFIGATGSELELQRLTRPLGILYAKVMTEKCALDYVMDHSASIVLVDPQGRYHALFSPPHDAGLMLDDFLTISGNTTL
ncbi:MAG: SCO family protein [Gammaproteobacteria bacterium]|nr:SCO family protein [Gammaproteobacteria bacterium]